MKTLEDLISILLNTEVSVRDVQQGLFHTAVLTRMAYSESLLEAAIGMGTINSLEQLLELCNPEAYVVVLGDTAPLSPILFDYGIDAISGTKVIDPALALRCVSEGATYRQIKGICQLTMTRNGRQIC